MDRRKFVGAGTAALAALAVPKGLLGQTCDNRTLGDRYGMGPFHTDGAPRKVKLASEFEPGQRISVQGTVANCSGPVSGVNLDVWHATDGGCYQHPSDACPDIPGHPESFRLRGQMVTDRDGKFAFESILPGAYLNGSAYRPRHIHVIISQSPGVQIVTQLYFAGDPYIKGDFGADEPGAANRIIPWVKTVPALWKGTWNIQIPGVTTGLIPQNDPAMMEFDVYARRLGNSILFHLPPNTSRQPVELRVYDLAGALVKRSLMTGLPVELDIGSLRAGSYMVDLSWWTLKGLRKESVPIRI
ncbi:MAG: hypothetical protein JWP91_4729 [Fibrobacteres bacterium]|nr:hypothetical protein [Fibrobacterota bacterium]